MQLSVFHIMAGIIVALLAASAHALPYVLLCEAVTDTILTSVLSLERNVLARAVIPNPAQHGSLDDRDLQTRGRGGYNASETRDEGVYNALEARGRGGYNSPESRGRGGYNGPEALGRGGYNGPESN